MTTNLISTEPSEEEMDELVNSIMTSSMSFYSGATQSGATHTQSQSNTSSPFTLNSSGSLGIGTTASSWIVNSTASSNGYLNGSSITVPNHASITMKGDAPTITTDKHEIDVNELYEDVGAIKKIMIELANDENLMERNAVIREILGDWLIKGLSK